MWHENVDLLAYHDLDGRSGFKLALQEAAGRFFLYVAGFWHSGWSILEVTDPEHPELLRFVDGPPSTWTLQVQVADGTMITALEHLPRGLTIGDPKAEPQDGFLIWDVHEPDRPQLLGQWVSGAAGTHRNFCNGGQWVYATSTLPGFEGHVLVIVDISDPANSLTVGTWWHPGQNKAAGETYTPEDERRLTAGRPYPQHGLSLHGGAYVLGDRAYAPWMRGGMVILDITDKQNPKHVSTLPVYPPLGSTIAAHSAVPLPGRDVVVINSEALRLQSRQSGSGSSAPGCAGPCPAPPEFSPCAANTPADGGKKSGSTSTLRRPWPDHTHQAEQQDQSPPPTNLSHTPTGFSRVRH